MLDDMEKDIAEMQFIKDYRKATEKRFNKSQEAFDKQLVYITAGALGLSFVLIDKVVKDVHHSKYIWMLISGWSLLIFTLVLNLASHAVAAYLHRETVAIIDRRNIIREAKSIDKKSNVLIFLNYIFYFFMLLGIVFIFLFASLNILQY